MKKYILIYLLQFFCITNLYSQTTPPSYESVFHDFKNLVAQKKVSGDIPTLRNPIAAKLLHQLTNEKVYLNSKHDTSNDLVNLNGICQMSTEVAMIYLSDGIENEVNSSVVSQSKNNSRLEKLANNNLVKYKRELGLIYPFTFRCMAKTIHIVKDHYATTSVEELTTAEKLGIKKIKTGTRMIYLSGFSLFIKNPNLGDEFSLQMFKGLSDAGTVLIPVMPVTERKQVLMILETAEQSLPASTHAYIVHLRNILKDQMCDTLCKV